jgi:L,D-transpeptidase ErfK/SrfK
MRHSSRATLAAAVAAATLTFGFAGGYSDPLVTVVPRPGTTMTGEERHIVPAWSGERPRILINVAQRLLFLFEADRVEALPVAVGRVDWQTPLGEFRIVMKEERPTWDVPISIQEEMRRTGKRVITRMPPGPANPLGSHWIGLSGGGIGIHGTPLPATLRQFSTHGCIRVHPGDIPHVFSTVEIGDRVQIVDIAVLIAATDEGVFVEAHRDPYGRSHAAAPRDDTGADGIDAATLADVLRRREGVARRVDTTHTKGSAPSMR